MTERRSPAGPGISRSPELSARGLAGLMLLAACGESPTTLESPLAITTLALPDAVVAMPYDFALSATGGRPSYRFSSLAALPAGLALSEEGRLLGTPTEAGLASLELSASDQQNQLASVRLSLRIWSTPPETGPARCAEATLVPLGDEPTHVEGLLPAAGPESRCGDSASAYYQVQPSQDGVLEVEVRSGRGAQLSVAPAGCPVGPALIACTESTSAQVTAGAFLLIVSGETGADYALTVHFEPRRVGCEAPTLLDLSSGQQVVPITLAESRFDSGACVGDRPLVFAFDLEAPRSLSVAAPFGSVRLALGQSACSEEIACTPNDVRLLVPELPPGRHYLTVSADRQVSGELSVELGPPIPRPDNDRCASATPLRIEPGELDLPVDFRGVRPETDGSSALYYDLEITESGSLTLASLDSSLRFSLATDCPAKGWVSAPLCFRNLPPGHQRLRIEQVLGAPPEPPTATIEFVPARPIDLRSGCAGAEALTASAQPIQIQGSFADADNDGRGSSWNCSSTDAPKLYFSLNLTERSDLQLITSDGIRNVLIYPGSCDGNDGAGCFGSPSGSTAYALPPGPVWLAFEGYGSVEPGQCTPADLQQFAATLEVRPTPSPPSNDGCATATPIVLDGLSSSVVPLRGTLLGAQDDVGPRLCPLESPTPNTGADVWFALQLLAPARLRLTQSDGPTELIASLHAEICDAPDALACTGGRSDGNFSTPILSPGTYYLRVEAQDLFTPPSDFAYVLETLP